MTKGPRDEARNPPRVRDRHGPLLVRQHVHHAIHQAGAPRGALLELPPVLHGQAEAGRHRRPRGALPAPLREAPAVTGPGSEARVGSAGMLGAMSSEPSARAVPSREHHLYGGQAVLEGVMMRGRDHWAIAVRRPDTTVHLESHEIDSVAKRYRFLRWPGFRGVIAMGQALGIGFRALLVSANQATPEEEQLSSKQMAIS